MHSDRGQGAAAVVIVSHTRKNPGALPMMRRDPVHPSKGATRNPVNVEYLGIAYVAISEIGPLHTPQQGQPDDLQFMLGNHGSWLAQSPKKRTP